MGRAGEDGSEGPVHRAPAHRGRWITGGLAIVATLVIAVGIVAWPRSDDPSTPAAGGLDLRMNVPTYRADGASYNCGPDGIYGWGASQPVMMQATVHYGCSRATMTTAQRQVLARQLVEIRRVGLAVGTVAEALKEGFVKNFQFVQGRGFEYVNWKRFTSKLDLAKPTILAFDGDQPDSRVMSVAYNVLGSLDAGPPKLFPLDAVPWHYHSNFCKKGDSVIGTVNLDKDGKPFPDNIKRCARLGATFEPQLNSWMTDFWVIPGWENPWGLSSSKTPDRETRPPVGWFGRPSTNPDCGPADVYGWGADPLTGTKAMVRRGCSSKRLTKARRLLLGSQLVQARQAATAVGTVARAVAAGYVKSSSRVDGVGYEYVDRSHLTQPLDLTRPLALYFAEDTPSSTVIAVSYGVPGTLKAGPPTVLPLEAIPWTYEPALKGWDLKLWVMPAWENPWGLTSRTHPDLFPTPVAWWTTSRPQA